MRGGFLHGWRGGGAPANWGRWGQLASGERSLKEGGEDREACQSRSRQMSGQLPQDPSATPPPPAHRMLTSFHHYPSLQMSCFQLVLCKHLPLQIQPIFTPWTFGEYAVLYCTRGTNRGCTHCKCPLFQLVTSTQAFSFQRVE